jgi:hypothetical protein
MKCEIAATMVVQKVFRGHLGRKVSKKWIQRRREIDAMRALQLAGATSIERVYRGRLGRIAATEVRVCMYCSRWWW